MLRLIIGKAGSGKTAAIINEIKEAVEKKQGGCFMIVPEQYSHEAERELCALCGESLSLYAEVLSFTALGRYVAAKQGGGARKYLDKGGRLLCMALALNNVSSRLKLYNKAAGSPEMQDMLLNTLDELKSACVTADNMLDAAENCQGGLKDRLTDMALILESYEAVVERGSADPSDRLSVLKEQIEQSDFSTENKIYVDGFIDFTNQENQVLLALLKKGVELTVCMNVDDIKGDNEIYELSRISCRKLLKDAKESGIETEIQVMESSKELNALDFYAEKMFSYGKESFSGDKSPISLVTAESISAECEFAAAKALSLVRDKGLRWRDIAVAVRGFDDYRETLENTFKLYGVPLYTARKSEIMQKPLPVLISLAYEITAGGWDTDELISYIRTGLTGLNQDECDLLSDYIFLWQLKASAWHRKEDWTQHPEGYGAEDTEKSREKLKEINRLRRIVAEPLLNLQRRTSLAQSAQQQASALTEFMAELKLPEKMQQRSEMLKARGELTLFQEYRQLWDIIVNAIEQSAAVLGDTPMDGAGYGRLFMLMLSKYDVGSIPAALDRVSAGDFDRMRRRNIKELIVLGCSDDRLPQVKEQSGVFSDEDRQALLELNIDLGAVSELWREFSLIYNCLSLPRQGLCLSYSLVGEESGILRPSFPYKRAGELFDIKPERTDMNKVRLSAKEPALELCANSFYGQNIGAISASEYFKEHDKESYLQLEAASKLQRGRLSPSAVEQLYGKRLYLSPSRIDTFQKCKFAYFCQYGISAKPYEPAGFKPPEIGTFMHYILEKTARDVKEQGGFKKVSDEFLKQSADKHIKDYIHRELNDFREKSQRFKYIFHRLCKDVQQIVLDMAEEMRSSDFEPMDFELDFKKAQDIEPLKLEGEPELSLVGIADRVDGWVHEGKLYLRVVDYKTGKKKFSLSDIYYGMNLQMLLYLFTLSEGGSGHYEGQEILPAGVSYVPARNSILSLQGNVDDEKEQAERRKELKRSGLVLENSALIEAWEKGEDKKYIPLKFKGGAPTEESLASLERMGVLSRHIKESLENMASELKGGCIKADPFYRSQGENACLNCKYFPACHFVDGENGEYSRFMPKLKDRDVWSRLEGEKENE